MAQIKVKELFLSILLRGALGTGRRALLLLKQRAIQYKTNICCYFSKLESDVAAVFFFVFFFALLFWLEEQGIKGKVSQNTTLPFCMGLALSLVR